MPPCGMVTPPLMPWTYTHDPNGERSHDQRDYAQRRACGSMPSEANAGPYGIISDLAPTVTDPLSAVRRRLRWRRAPELRRRTRSPYGRAGELAFDMTPPFG